MMWDDEPDAGIPVNTALDGPLHAVTHIQPPDEFHEFVLDCAGASFTIRVDGQTIYGPVTSALRPTAIVVGNPNIAFWYPTDWASFGVDYIRVEAPGPVPVAARTWGAIKSSYRD